MALQKVGERVFDNIIAGSIYPMTAQSCTIAAGNAGLRRGTILARNGAGTYQILGTPGQGETLTAELILADDVEAATGTVVAQAYRSGEFFENYLTVDTGYTLTAEDRAALKDAGIYLRSGVEV